MSRIQSLGLALLPLAVLTTPQVVADDNALTAEMVVDLHSVDSVALSPDGDHIAYMVEVPREAEEEPGKSYFHLWLADTDSGEPRRFTSGKERARQPAFSPDGQQITFTVKRKTDHEDTQIYAIPADGGEARPLTEHDGSISAYRWSPDGQWIAYTAKAADSEEVKNDKEAGKDWKVLDQDLKFRTLWLLHVETGETHRAFEEELDDTLDVNLIRWTPDSKTLVFQANQTARTDDEYLQTRIYRAAADQGQPEMLTATEGKLAGMEVSPGGKHLAYLGAVSLNDPLAQSLFVVPADGGTARNLTEGYEGSATHVAWQDEDTLLLLAAEGEQNALYRVDVATGKRTPLPLGELIVDQLDAQGGRIAFAASTPSHPAEVFVANGNGAAPKRRSYLNPELAEVTLARQETIQWQGADDWPIGGVLTYPLDYQEGQRYPLVLQVHGGPEGVSLNGWRTRAGYPVQLLAAKGFMVLEPNYRGSQGRGVAFSKADHDDLGGKEFDDILAGVDALIERGLVDTNRVGTGGWSYGGYMSAWAATRWTERFQASVVAAGLTNWISFAGTTDIPNEMSIVHWNSWWYDQPELHWKRSPMAYLNQAKTPTLVVTGAKDERVHPEQGLQLYTGLRLKQVPTEMVYYPREPHGLDERAHQLDFIERTVGWFEKYLSVPHVEAMDEPKN